MKTQKFRNIINEEDYATFKGGSWPEYEDFIAGEKAVNPEIQSEIDNFVTMMTKDGVKFPINTKTACQSKWTWSTIYLNQLSTASCHRVNPIPFDIEDFDNFHNIPKKIDDRKLMLEGKWPTGGCEYCKDIEDAGGFSDRMHNLDIRDLTPPELENSITKDEVYVTPRILELFAQNTCTFSCTYCNSNLSSKIENENKKFGNFSKGGVEIPITNVPTATDEYFNRFLIWLEKNISVLKRLHLLGGETFIQHDLMNSVLKIIENNPNPNLELCVFSNMNVPDKFWNLYTNWIKDLADKKHIKRFDLTASIDCWGDEAEYARYGLNLDKFEERFAWAASEDPTWLKLNVNQTVTCLTMRTMADLIDKVSSYSKYKHIGHYFQFYTGPQMFQHPNTFAYDFWEKDFDNIFKAMPKNTEEQLEAIPRMTGMQKYLQTFTTHNREDIEKLKILLDELDRRRKTNWRNVFPYLDI